MNDSKHALRLHFGLALTLSAGLAACQGEAAGDSAETGSETGHAEHGDGDGDADTDATETETDGDLAPTYWQEVAPIYYESCVECHREGGIGPFVLDDYASAASWGQASAMAVENRVMPPWLVSDDGSCNSWHDSPALSEDEIDTILAWVDAGSPEGTPRTDLERPTLPGLDGGETFSTPLFTPEPEGGIFSQYDEYRCFILDTQLEADRFITGYHVRPGNEALVHHVLVSNVDPNYEVEPGVTNLDVIEALDGASPDRLGWPCFGVAGDGVEFEGIPVSWAPGMGATEFPDGSGPRVGSEDLLIAQVHYNMADAAVIGQSDTTQIDIRFAEEVEREALIDLPDGLLASLEFGDPYAIPAGEEEHTFTWSFPVEWYIGWQGAESLELWGVFPHMHEHGTGMSVRVLDSEGEEIGCAAEVPRWDFNWQLFYFMNQPIVLEAGMQIEISCRYDTTDVEEALWPGWGTYNEMCLTGLYLLPG